MFVDEDIEMSFDELVKAKDHRLVLGNNSDIGIRKFYEQPNQPIGAIDGDRWLDTDEGVLYNAITINNKLIWMEA